MTENEIKEGKLLAILAYFPIFGTLIAFFLNADKKNNFTSFHIRQALGLWLLQFTLGYIIGGFDSWMISTSFWVFFGALLIYGILNAIAGKCNPIPLLGDFFQRIFKSLGQ